MLARMKIEKRPTHIHALRSKRQIPSRLCRAVIISTLSILKIRWQVSSLMSYERSL